MWLGVVASGDLVDIYCCGIDYTPEKKMNINNNTMVQSDGFNRSRKLEKYVMIDL